MNPWIYKGTKITSLEDFPEDAYGFIYVICFSDGKSYIGKKNLYSERKKKFGKRKLAQLEDKRLKKYEIIKKESDWLTYTGSKKHAQYKQAIESGQFTRFILDIAKNKKHLTYLELKALINHDVLLDDDYLNDNILGKFFPKDLR